LLTEKCIDTLESFSSKEFVEQIYTYKIIMPQNAKTWILYDEKNDKIINMVTPDSLKLIIRGERYLNNANANIFQGYNPTCRSRFFIEHGKQYFNTYTPPKWKSDYWLSGVRPKAVPIPPIYLEFLGHLLDNRQSDINYILDWTAISLQSRNLTYLVTAGQEGVGKGVFGKILELLHGSDNYLAIGGQSIKKQFNSQFHGKTLIYINEINDISGDLAEKVKLFNEDHMEVEKKGIDSETLRNYANFYFSTNNLDAIKLSENQRRYSFVDITRTRFQFTDYWNDLYNPSNISNLASALFSRDFEKKYIATPYRSATTQFIQTVNDQDWQIYIREEMCTAYRGKHITISDLNKLLKFLGFKGITHVKTKIYASGLGKFKMMPPKDCSLWFDDNLMKLSANPNSCTSNAIISDAMELSY
jgi:hypothetical protein